MLPLETQAMVSWVKPWTVLTFLQGPGTFCSLSCHLPGAIHLFSKIYLTQTRSMCLILLLLSPVTALSSAPPKSSPLFRAPRSRNTHGMFPPPSLVLSHSPWLVLSWDTQHTLYLTMQPALGVSGICICGFSVSILKIFWTKACISVEQVQTFFFVAIP